MPTIHRRASFVLALGLALSPAAFAQSVDQALERARALEAESKYAQVIDVLAPHREAARPEVDYALAYAHLNRQLQGAATATATEDYAQALRLANRAAGKDHGPSLYLLSLIHGNGWGVPVDAAKSRGFLERAAKAGDVVARADYAVMLYQGRLGLPRDVATACALFAEVLVKEEVGMVASYYLGLATARGECGLGPDMAKALALIRRAADAGVTEAERDMGRALETGDGIARNLDAALVWYARAANKGDAFSLWRLGMAHVRGQGRPLDIVLGVDYLKRAVAAGSPDAMASLAALLAAGDGVAQDFGMARALYQRAARAGQPQAHRDLALLHLAGQGAPADAAQAWVNYQKAIALGLAPEPKLEAAIKAAMSPAQAGQAEAELAQWRQSRP
ncbi:tetratricopeptide repeat protein [Arenimonas sp.]|uniref:tetratricopeptide repeat protein n=1 Tax=Arenimonas sp. TaxID=1872635 RepID=UPI002E326297|nr:tetratricopeptide repeat protein [Arenimonas sp.]HEX4853389.1 tetratricopeptide repeat protein [Arenimonas sp.]